MAVVFFLNFLQLSPNKECVANFKKIILKIMHSEFIQYISV